ncbi:hypothetical protein [Agromyces mangrovi Wang et al. 2018]|uniref:hypothetical protein n=1 Tax=Agromyces mangrovi TaxID=1858653 RepID=UPI002572C1BA|nr:hypothetical protein [Agromyces mangrovi]BDZ63453.1 hypothetical protein GCM10025877_03910 [Agromyces mangrovi]
MASERIERVLTGDVVDRAIPTLGRFSQQVGGDAGVSVLLQIAGTAVTVLAGILFPSIWTPLVVVFAAYTAGVWWRFLARRRDRTGVQQPIEVRTDGVAVPGLEVLWHEVAEARVNGLDVQGRRLRTSVTTGAPLAPQVELLLKDDRVRERLRRSRSWTPLFRDPVTGREFAIVSAAGVEDTEFTRIVAAIERQCAVHGVLFARPASR